MMQYSVNYQYLPKNSPNGRPLDNGAAVDMPTTDGEIMPLPNVGDYVAVDRSHLGGEGFAGKVRSKLFRYTISAENQWCFINIIVEEDTDDWGMLIKE